MTPLTIKRHTSTKSEGYQGMWWFSVELSDHSCALSLFVIAVPELHICNAELHYHSRTPIYEGHNSRRASCDHLGGAPCYADIGPMEGQAIWNTHGRPGAAEQPESLWLDLETRLVMFAEELTMGSAMGVRA